MPSVHRVCALAVVLVSLVACGNDHAAPDDLGIPTYIEDVAPILEAKCNSCHGAPTTAPEAQNCVRLDRWDSMRDTNVLCTDLVMEGLIFGVHDAAALLVDQVIEGQMPFGGPMLAARDVSLLRAWRDAGFPRRAPNIAPTTQFSAPTTNVTVCNPTCTYAVAYSIADPDGDSVTWSLDWSGNGRTGTFATRLSGGTGTVTIDASSLASGTYTLTAVLDDGTATVSTDAPGTLTIPAGHNAAPTIAVLAPNGGESYYDTQAISVSWNGGDADGASLTYDVVALQATTTIPIVTGLVQPVGLASTLWTPPQVSSVTPYRIRVTAHDGGTPALSAVDTSDASFALSPPPQMVSFANQLQPIFNASCTDAQCHDANMPQQGLSLTAGVAYGALVNVSSTQNTCASYKLVQPGHPEQSYLVFKLAGSGACFSGSRMPKGAPALSAAQLQLFRDWIANGAPNN
jgi:hypothetical protein